MKDKIRARALNHLFLVLFLGIPCSALSNTTEISVSKTFVADTRDPVVLDSLSPTNRAILLLCKEAEPSLEKSNTLDKKSILKIATIGKQLAEYFRNNGDITSKATSEGITKDVYLLYCGKLREWFSKQSNTHSAAIGDKEWSVLLDSKLFIEFALLSANSLGDILLESRILHLFWYYLNATGQNQQAESTIKRSLDLLVKHSHDPNEYIQVILKLNTVLKRQGKYGENIKYLASAMRLQNQIGEKNLEHLFFSAGFLNRDLGQFDIAQRYFRLSIESHRVRVDDKTESLSCRDRYRRHLDVGKTYTQMALVARLQEDLAEARRFLNCANWFLSLERDYYEIVALIEEARLAMLSGNYPVALKKTQVVFNDSRALPMQRLDALLVSLESSLELEDEEKFEDTLVILSSILGYKGLKDPLKIAKPTSDYPIRQIQLFRILIDWSNKQSNVAKAKEYYRLAESLINQVRNQTLVPQAWDAARYSLVDSFIETVWQSKGSTETNNEFVSRIWDVLEKFQLPQLEQEKRLLSWSVNEEKDRQAYENWISAKRALFFASQSGKLQAQRIADAAEATFFKDSLIRSETNTPAKLLSLLETQMRLEDGQALLRYFTGQKLSFVIILDNQNVKIRRVNSIKQIKSIIGKNNNVFLNAPKSIFSDENITSLLPTESISSGRYNKIIIMPDGILHHLPFSAINVSHSKRYLPVTAFAEIVNIQTASEFFSKEDYLAASSYRTISIFAASDDPERFNTKAFQTSNLSGDMLYRALRGVRAEADSIKNLFQKENTFIGVGNTATNDFLMSEVARNTDILHIATHGIYDPELPGNNGLLTHDSDGGLSTLTHSELMSRPFTSKLVVISGCETMQGKLYRGSGVHSLSRSFLAQGAVAALGTLWVVNDEPTEKFMKDFYANLKLTQSPSKALMQTKRDFSRFGRYKHPKFWAGFVLSERGRLNKQPALNKM